MIRIAVMISGRGSNLQALIDAQNRRSLFAKIAIVISNVESAQGISRAKQNGIPYQIVDHKLYKSREEHEKAILIILKQYMIDYIVCAGYMRIITPLLINAYLNRIINIHPALLPSFPGLHAQKQALEYGVKITGCTTHFIDTSVDGGPIILQKAVKVHDSDTEDTLSDRILQVEHELIVDTVNILSKGNYNINGRKIQFMTQNNDILV